MMGEKTALDLLEELSEELTDMVTSMEPSDTREKLNDMAGRVDEFLYDAGGLTEVDEYDDDDDDCGEYCDCGCCDDEDEDADLAGGQVGAVTAPNAAAKGSEK